MVMRQLEIMENIVRTKTIALKCTEIVFPIT